MEEPEQQPTPNTQTSTEPAKARKPRLNELDGRTWSKYSISVWDIAKTSEERKFHHPAMFPTELCRRLIEMYTKKGDVVIDPFLGSGSTLVAAQERQRKGAGLDINDKFVNLAKTRLGQLQLFDKGKKDTAEEQTCVVFKDEAKSLLKHVKEQTADLCITSPPYWSILQRKRTADYKASRPYSALENDLGNIDDYDKFMMELRNCFQQVYAALKPGKRCVVVVMDIRVLSKFTPYHMDISSMMGEIGFILEDIIIWNRQREYNNLRPLGYPYVFIVNKIHEYLLIFRKNKETEPLIWRKSQR